MIAAALDTCGKDLPALMVTKYDHTKMGMKAYGDVAIIEAAHPVPDQHSLYAGKALLEFVSRIETDGHLLLLVSGGASALAEALVGDNSLEDLQELNRRMLAEGHDIHAINRRRKEISRIKGGKLLSHFAGASTRVLAISDVEGDDLSVIGSGIGQLPTIRQCTDMETRIVASNAIARLATEDAANTRDIDVIVNTENLYGDVIEVARDCADTVRQGAPGLYIFGGEPTTVLPDEPGEGGRNQALALAMARELGGISSVSVLAAGTDGSDGPSGSAGGFVTGESWQEHPGGQEALDAANSGAWLRGTRGLFVTGPTGTNVMDVMVVLKG